MSTSAYNLAVILPVYNEGDRIQSVVKEVTAFASKRLDYYFLFVDDGSTDRTAYVLKEALAGIDNVAVVGYSPNRGKGFAVRFGFDSVDAQYYCFTDSDLAYPLEMIEVLESELSGFDVVIGSRKLLDRKRRPNLLRHILGEGYNRLMRLTLGLPYRDTQAGFKGFRREVVKRVFPKMSIPGFGFDPEVLFLSKKYGFALKEIPVKEADSHNYKTCKIKLSKDSIRMFMDLLSVRFKDLLGRYD